MTKSFSFSIQAPLAACSLGILLMAVGPLALAQQASRISINAEPARRDFIPAHARAENTAAAKSALPNITLTTLPSILVYSPEGVLIYEGGGEVRDKNFALMEGMPASVEHMAPVKNRPSLAAMLELVPELKAQ